MTPASWSFLVQEQNRKRCSSNNNDQHPSFITDRRSKIQNSVNPAWVEPDRRAKWHNQSDVNLKSGDLIWVIEPDAPRGHYPLARIRRLHYGKDGCARSADIKTVTRELTRPTVKLAPVLPCLGVEDVAAQI